MSLPILRWDSGFNPRTPCGVRRLCLSDNDICEIVSIHALLAECDPLASDFFPLPEVSIHALLAECDRCYRLWSLGTGCFNPRTPCGVRLQQGLDTASISQFQSTHSLRSATFICCPIGQLDGVSIHALLAECDRWLGKGA